MVENNSDAVFPHSLSYEENYHAKYYYPRLICCRRAMQAQQQSPTHKLLITEISGGSVVSKIARPPPHCPSSSSETADRPGDREERGEASSNSPQCSCSVDGTPVRGQCTFEEAGNNDTLSEPCQENTAQRHHHSMQSCDVDDAVERARPLFKLSDSEFSDDYTQMTEVGGDTSDTDRGGRFPEEDASTSTLETPNSDIFSDGSSPSVDNTTENGGPGFPKVSSPTCEDGEENPLAGFERALRLDIEAANKVAAETGPYSPDEQADTTSPPEVNLIAGSDLNLDQIVQDEDFDGELPTEGTFYEDREFEFLKAEPVRRSTSLKTYKTPPGTPGKKKMVRFADALGLDLESVRHILNLDVPPKIPASATRDLEVEPEQEKNLKTEGARYMTACFSQPGASPSFPLVVRDRKVMLENCVINDQVLTITGTVRVANIHYHKHVVVRYTTNNWLTFNDINAGYVHNSNDGQTDRFSFSISVPQYFSTGSRLEFCIQYKTGDETYWDSNYGSNYVIECYARAAPADSDNSWMSFL